MLLGKRRRPPMRRTTSMSGITAAMEVEEEEPSDAQRDHHHAMMGPEQVTVAQNVTMNSGENQINHPLMVATRDRRRNLSQDFTHTPYFLGTCSLCKRRLAAGKDIYMYRGDSAFCSQECREQQMRQDERTNQRNLAYAAQTGNQ